VCYGQALVLVLWCRPWAVAGQPVKKYTASRRPS
jgi:hypothetical protein